MKPRDYCCCAIPIVNPGIYVTLTEQFLIGILVGILSLATPSIVGAVTPSFAASLFAVLCFVAAAIQVLGFIGVAKEKAILYRRYVTLHGLITTAVFAVAAAWIILSATRHSTAKSKCLTNFFAADNAAQTSEGNVLCEIFPWVDVGVMCGLWVVLGLLQLYLYTVLSSYGHSQRRDHEKYDRLHNDSIPMNRRNDPWDSRNSTDSLYSPGNRSTLGYNHVRQGSGGSVSEMVARPQLQLHDASANPDYHQQPHSPLAHDDSPYNGTTAHRDALSHA